MVKHRKDVVHMAANERETQGDHCRPEFPLHVFLRGFKASHCRGVSTVSGGMVSDEKILEEETEAVEKLEEIIAFLKKHLYIHSLK